MHMFHEYESVYESGSNAFELWILYLCHATTAETTDPTENTTDLKPKSARKCITFNSESDVLFMGQAYTLGPPDTIFYPGGGLNMYMLQLISVDTGHLHRLNPGCSQPILTKSSNFRFSIVKPKTLYIHRLDGSGPPYSQHRRLKNS